MKMMEKLGISAIPELEFDDGDTVYKFNQLY
jgi:serine/threonine protein kinase